ncbi:MAG TPA: hypothetical protein VF898_10995 [Chloroflexota bacterium]
MPVSPDLPTFAADIAPHVDRLFIAGHHAARPFARLIAAEFGIRSFGLLIDLRRPLLCPGGISAAEVEFINRYYMPQDLSASLQAHVLEGLLWRDNAFYLPTSLGKAVLQRLTQGLSSGLSQEWTDAGRISTASALAENVVQEAASTYDAASAPAFSAQRPDCPPADQTPSFRLWDRLLLLRYLRADCHANTWKEAGLDAPRAGVLDAFWHAAGPLVVTGHLNRNNPPLLSLQERGWVSRQDETWLLTAEGRAIRERIEEQTNAAAGRAFGVLDEVERDALLASLSSLP